MINHTHAQSVYPPPHELRAYQLAQAESFVANTQTGPFPPMMANRWQVGPDKRSDTSVTIMYIVCLNGQLRG